MLKSKSFSVINKIMHSLYYLSIFIMISIIFTIQQNLKVIVIKAKIPLVQCAWCSMQYAASGNAYINFYHGVSAANINTSTT